MTSLAALIRERADLRPDHPFLEDARSDRRIAYRDLAAGAADWAATLRARRIPPGAAVLLDVDDPLAFTVAHLGVLVAGCCSVPVDPDAPPAELGRTVRGTGPVLALTDRPARTTLPTVPVDPLTGRPAWSAAAPDAHRGPHLAAAPAGSEPAGAVRLSTSGSTGEPKAVQLGEGRLLHVAAAVAAHHRIGPGDRGYNPLPLFHINAEVVGVLATLVAGGTLVLDRRFHPRGLWQLLQDREITWCNAVPAILTILAEGPLPPVPPTLRFLRSASAPLPPAVRRRIESALGVPVVESYGMTEAASQITATPLDGSAPDGSAGRPVDVDLQVRTPGGALAEAGRLGRVWIRGPGVITGYVGGRAADRFDPGGWLDTGDLGRVDADGFLFHAGRADDVINRGGEMVYPREVEEALMQHPRVLEAVVVGQPHQVLGAVPVAFVLARPGDEQTLPAELRALCDAQLSRFKRPAAFHLVADLPHAPTGKVRRHEVVLAARTGP